MKRAIAASCCLLLISCAVYEPDAIMCQPCQNPSYSNGYSGRFGIRTDDKSSSPVMIAEKFCSRFNGVKTPPSIYSRFPLYDYFQFECIGFTSTQKVISPPLKQDETISVSPPVEKNRTSLDDAKVKCSEIGFKQGTEGFGKCVLQLTK